MALPDTLYLDEDAIARRVLGPNARQWSDIAAVLEREGLPRVDPLMGGRYWPAVKEFLDRRHGLRREAVPISADGEEVWP
jgi:hypothetical protein